MNDITLHLKKCIHLKMEEKHQFVIPLTDAFIG